MNKDEILNMQAGREMDDMIARHIFKINSKFIPPFSGWTSGVGDYCVDTSIPELKIFKHSGPIENYSTDIAAAWRVIVWLDTHGHDVTIENCVAGWRCEIDQNHTGRDVFAPMAICRAALLAVTEKE